MVDVSCMTLNFLGRRKVTAECTHRFQMRIEVAGMSREVCESCGQVSVGYVEDHFLVEPALEAEDGSESNVDSAR